jgi:hypothetical protein
MPPGRCVSVRAKKSSNAKPRKKLSPRRRATLTGAGVVFMRRPTYSAGTPPERLVSRPLGSNFRRQDLVDAEQIL